MSDTPGSNYSRLDRLLHRWAFSGIEIQKSLADMVTFRVRPWLHPGSGYT